MKFFVAFAALVALTSAGVSKPEYSEQAELEAVIAAINSPSTDPATAALLEEQLQQIMGGGIAVGPAIVDEVHDISIEPALVDFPIPDVAIQPTPVVDVPTSSPLVQIIVNVKQTSDIAPAEIVPSPVIVVDDAPEADIVPSPVVIVDEAPVAPIEPVIIGQPILPTPVINIPETLN